MTESPTVTRTHDRRAAIVLATVALGLLTLVVQFTGLTDRPVGFYQDESSFAYNAWTIAQRGVDEHDRPWPIFFEAFGDWKTAPYIYGLAAVFKITGPSLLAARVFSAAAGVLAVILLAGLAYRATRRPEIFLLTGATALLLPWTFEPTRLAMEVAVMPALIAGFLFALHARPPTVLSGRTVLLLASILALITYTYTLGRLLAPLFALGLLVFVTRERWQGVVATWALYAAMLIPFGLFELTTPGALSLRFRETGYLGLPPTEFVATFAQQFLGNLDPVRLLLVGDPNGRHHAPGIMGSLLMPTLLLALIGIDRVIHRLRADPWHRYLLYGVVASIIPAALTLDGFHAHRAIGVPVFLIALSIPAQAWLLADGRGEHWRRAVFAVLAVATLVQGAYFQLRYDTVARDRGHWFDAAYPNLLEQALATGSDPVYLEDGIVPGYIHAYWYGSAWAVPIDRFVRLPRDTRAPPGAVVLSSVTDCSPCEQLAAGGFFRLYREPEE